MNWERFFYDLQKWMQASNAAVQHFGLDQDEYWHWLLKTMLTIKHRYHDHPLVTEILLTVTYYQGEQLAKLHGTHLDLSKAGDNHETK